MVASIISTMTGNYCRDASMDNTHLQDMGSDAAVLLGYYDKSVSMWIKIHRMYVCFFTQILIWILPTTLHRKLQKENVIKLVPMNPDVSLAEKDVLKRSLFRSDDKLFTKVMSEEFQEILRTDPRYGARQCGPLNNALNPTLRLKNSFFLRREGYSPYLSTYDEWRQPDETAQKTQITYQTPVGKMRVPVRHLSSSKLECRPNELARGHFGGASKYSVAINSFVYFIS